MDIVGGWSDGERVYLVERSGEDVRIRATRGKWSAWLRGTDDEDRVALQRSRGVTGVTPEGELLRVDFRNRWERQKVVETLLGYEKFRQGGPFVLEGDVNPLRRLLCDHPGINVSPDPRLAWLDLETDSRKSFDEMRAGKARVTCWSVFDQGRRLLQGCLEADTDAAERALLERLLEVLRPYDVVLAWNGDGFDFPVLSARAERLRCQPGGKPPLWNRWCWLDHLEVHRKYNAHAHESGDEKSSFKLGDVGQVLLGRGKLDVDASKAWQYWEAGGESRARLLEYNGRDAELAADIEGKTGYVALHLAVCSVTRCLPDSQSLMASQQGDGFLMALGAANGHRWPTKRRFDEENPFASGGSYEGAYVMEPTRLGAIDDVHVCDFAGLYPSIMRTWNMSPDTALAPRDPDPPGGSCRLPTERGTRFRLDRRGMLPRALDELVAKRAEYTRKMDAAPVGSPEWDRYKRLSGAFKIVANSFYGICGSPFTRFFVRDVAEGVSQTGAWLIKHVVASCKERGLDAFYGDTDSAYVTGCDHTQFAEFVAGLNAGWPAIVEGLGGRPGLIKLEAEKSFRRIVLVTAKRYAGSYSIYKGRPAPEGTKPEVKGLEYKRGDSLRIAREMQRELIGLLLAPELPGAEAVREFVARWRRHALEGELSVDDVALSQSVKDLGEYALRYTTRQCGGAGKGKRKQGCGRDFGGVEAEAGEEPEKCPKCGLARKLAKQPAHVRVARMLKERGEQVGSGSRIEYLVVGSGEDAEPVPARDPGALERIDRLRYWRERIYPPCQRVLEVTYPAAEGGWSEEPAAKAAVRRALAAPPSDDELPLFGGPALDAVPEGSRIVVTHDAEHDDPAALAKLRAAVDAAPGETPVRLELDLGDARVCMPAGSTSATPEQLERAAGQGSVRVEPRRGT